MDNENELRNKIEKKNEIKLAGQKLRKSSRSKIPEMLRDIYFMLVAP